MKIASLKELQDWLVNHRIPTPVAANGYALDAWEIALNKRTKGSIYAYWCMSGMTMHHRDLEIVWSEIENE